MIDLTGRDDIPVPEEVLAELSRLCTDLDLDYIVVGAAARDLAIHARQRTAPVRATEDIDIAVAVRRGEQFSELTARLAPTGRSQHRFEVLGVGVDVVPFGGIGIIRTPRTGSTWASSSPRCRRSRSTTRCGRTTNRSRPQSRTSSSPPATTTHG